MLHSEVIKQMIKDGYEDATIPIVNVDAKTFNKVIEYCKMHTQFQASEDDLKNWDAEFVNVDPHTLYDSMMTIADMIKGKSVEVIRKCFKIDDHVFTSNEEEQLRKENPSLFERKT